MQMPGTGRGSSSQDSIRKGGKPGLRRSHRHPQSTAAHRSRKGLCLESLRKAEEAVGCYETGIRFNPGLAEGWLHRGRMLISLGRREEGLSALERALTVESRKR